MALGFLHRSGDGELATYANSPETSTFLDKASPIYLGGILEMAGARLYRFWAGLTEGRRTGEAQNETLQGRVPMFEGLYREPEQSMRAMSGLSGPRFAALADRFDWSRYLTMVDLGGAAGDLRIALAESARTCG